MMNEAIATMSAGVNPCKNLQPRNVFSIIACLNWLASNGTPRSYPSVIESSCEKCANQPRRRRFRASPRGFQQSQSLLLCNQRRRCGSAAHHWSRESKYIQRGSVPSGPSDPRFPASQHLWALGSINPSQGEVAEVIQTRLAHRRERPDYRQEIFPFDRLQFVIGIAQEGVAMPGLKQSVSNCDSSCSPLMW